MKGQRLRKSKPPLVKRRKYNADAFAARKTSEAKQETAGKELPKVREDKAR